MRDDDKTLEDCRARGGIIKRRPFFGDPEGGREAFIPIRPRRLLLFTFTDQLIVDMLRSRAQPPETARLPLLSIDVPEDAVVRSVSYDIRRDCMVAVVEHPSFPEVREGCEIPMAAEGVTVQFELDERYRQQQPKPDKTALSPGGLFDNLARAGMIPPFRFSPECRHPFADVKPPLPDLIVDTSDGILRFGCSGPERDLLVSLAHHAGSPVLRMNRHHVATLRAVLGEWLDRHSPSDPFVPT